MHASSAEAFARTPELEWLATLQALMSESPPGGGDPRLGRAALLAWHQTRVRYGAEIDALRQRLRDALPELLLTAQEATSGPGPSQLELIEMLIAPLERLVTNRQHLLDERSPVAVLLQYVVERMGIDATVHRFDPLRLPRIVAALPGWLPNRGRATAAVALLEGLIGEPLDAVVRVPELKTVARTRPRPDLLSHTPLREALDAFQPIEHAGLLEAEEAPEEEEGAVEDAIEAELAGLVTASVAPVATTGTESIAPVLEPVIVEPTQAPVTLASLMESERPPPRLDVEMPPVDLGELMQIAEETKQYVQSVRTPPVGAAPASPAVAVETTPEVPGEADVAPATTVEDEYATTGEGEEEGLEGAPAEVLMSRPLSWYGHRHDQQPLVPVAPMVRGGVVQLAPSITARFPLAREDVLVSALDVREVLAPLLRLLPVWSSLRVHLRVSGEVG